MCLNVLSSSGAFVSWTAGYDDDDDDVDWEYVVYFHRVWCINLNNKELYTERRKEKGEGD